MGSAAFEREAEKPSFVCVSCQFDIPLPTSKPHHDDDIAADAPLQTMDYVSTVLEVGMYQRGTQGGVWAGSRPNPSQQPS